MQSEMYAPQTKVLEEQSQDRACISMQFYAPQTKILEDRTKDRYCLFEALFKGVSTGFGLLLVEKWFENTIQTACYTVQNLCGKRGKQHLREIATPDWVGHFTNETYSRA